jgi:hypothetical protein
VIHRLRCSRQRVLTVITQLPVIVVNVDGHNIFLCILLTQGSPKISDFIEPE